jgi:hypothetical protein
MLLIVVKFVMLRELGYHIRIRLKRMFTSGQVTVTAAGFQK